MAYKGHFQPSGLVWALRLTLAWILLVVCGGNHAFWGHHGFKASVDTGQLHLVGNPESLVPQPYLRTQDPASQASSLPESCCPLEMDTPEESGPGISLDSCGAPSPRCKTSWDTSNTHSAIASTCCCWEYAKHSGTAQSSARLGSPPVKPTSPVARLGYPSGSGKRGCETSCRTYGETFTDGADLCLSVLGHALPVAAPGSRHCFISISMPPRPVVPDSDNWFGKPPPGSPTTLEPGS